MHDFGRISGERHTRFAENAHDIEDSALGLLHLDELESIFCRLDQP
jgi:hypothetical protein